MTRDLFGETPLSFLLGTYFNQDWRLINGTPEETVQAFLRDNPDLALPLADQVEREISRGPNEKQLARLTRSMYGNFLANKVFGTYREWFASIEAQARAFAAAHPEPDR